MKVSPAPKLANSVQSKVRRILDGEALTSPPVIHIEKKQAKRMTNNFKEMVQNHHSDKNGDSSDFCNELKEYYCVVKQECDWIKFSVCEQWLYENCTVFS